MLLVFLDLFLREKNHELEWIGRWKGSVRRGNSVTKIYSMKEMFIKTGKTFIHTKISKFLMDRESKGLYLSHDLRKQKSL